MMGRTTPLPDEVVDLLSDPGSLKVLATTGVDGAPHVTVRDSLRVLDDGHLGFAEELDSSQTSKDLVRALWTDQPVVLGVIRGEKVWEIRGRPWRCLITGPLLKHFLLEARERQGPDADIAAVWVIRPDVAREESAATLRAVDRARRPYAGSHLDRASLLRGKD
jgi:hypothetical protein